MEQPEEFNNISPERKSFFENTVNKIIISFYYLYK